MFLQIVEMLKKKLGLNAIEKIYFHGSSEYYFKVPSTLIIPEDCVKIGGYAFYGCENLKKVVISESVKDIGCWAFGGCENARIVIKNKNTNLGFNAFTGCRGVKEEIRN